MSKNVLHKSEGILAVKIARQAIESSLDHLDPYSELPSTPIIFSEKRGAFVTLAIDGELRGCVGYPYPALPLKEIIVRSAIAAAFDDPRFFPLEKKDFSKMQVEVRTLTLPDPLMGPFTTYSNQIQIGTHGLIAEYKDNRGVLLPQAAVENDWDSVDFLSQVCVKAGLTPLMWKYGAKISRFERQVFRELAPGGAISDSEK
jgi:uncharacterized protein, PH0010 family